MTSPIVLRIHPKPDCLSAWQLAALACGDAEITPAVREHLTGCARCHSMLQAQQAEVAAATQEDLPVGLAEPVAKATNVTPLRARRRWPLASVGAGLALVAASALAVLQAPRTAPTVTDMTEGGVALLATVTRSDQLIAQDTPMQHVPVLKAGDRLRLHVTGALTGAHVQLDSRKDDRWVTLYDAALPADHWLPVGLRVDGESTTLRLKVCAFDGTQCDEHTFEL